jgi:hypothetical protein
MGFLDSLKKIFSSAGQPPDKGHYFYVKLDKSGEIVRLRLDPQHDLAPQYGKGTYVSRKAIIGPETLARADAVFTFDENRQFVEADISGGSLTDEKAYEAQDIKKSE